MSEVSDATQIVLLTARGGYLLGRISLSMAVRTLKLLDTLYHAKWKGKTSFNRLRQTKGEDMIFVNISTEKESLLKLIEAEMTAHQIMFARLPDLCGGDGRTQYAVSQADTERFKAFLLDHGTGPNRSVLVGPVRPEDYLATGEDTMKNPTLQMTRLEKDARETERESHEQDKDLQQDTEKNSRYDRKSVWKRKEPESSDSKQDQRIHETTPSQEAAYKEGRSETVESHMDEPEIRIAAQGREKIIPAQQFAEETEKIYPLVKREKELAYDTPAQTIHLEPLAEEEHFNLYMLPDGIRAVVIPKEDVRPVYINEKTGEKMPPLFNVFAMQRYVIIDPKDGVRDMVRGEDLLSLLNTVPISVKHAELTRQIQERMAPVAEVITKGITQR